MNTFSDLIPRANNNNKIALFPKLIVNCHLPASDGQALDVYFNAVFKTTLSHLRNKRIANEYIEFKSREEIRKTNAAASGNQFQPNKFVVKTKLSETKEHFYNEIAEALKLMQTDEKKGKIRNTSWAPLRRCFEQDFQLDAVRIVSADRTRKYFASSLQDDEGLVDAATATMNSASQLLADRLVEAHESLPTLDEDETCTESYYHKQFIGRQVHLVDMCPGIVTQYKATKGGFVVKYYNESLPQPKERKRCKSKLEIVGKRALLPLLLRTANRDERGNEDNNGEGVNENNDANENDGDNAIGDRDVNGNGDDNAIAEFGSAAVEG